MENRHPRVLFASLFRSILIRIPLNIVKRLEILRECHSDVRNDRNLVAGGVLLLGGMFGLRAITRNLHILYTY